MSATAKELRIRLHHMQLKRNEQRSRIRTLTAALRKAKETFVLIEVLIEDGAINTALERARSAYKDHEPGKLTPENATRVGTRSAKGEA